MKYLLILFVCYLITFCIANDMRYQRDVALVTADWCARAPDSQRCKQVVSGEWKIPHNFLYFTGIK